MAGDRQGGTLRERRVSISQVVAFNVAWFRKRAGLTQEEMGQRLGGWSAASVSAAERSWDGKRVRQFDADEIIAIAAVLGVPAIALLLPPPDAGTAIEYGFVATSAPVPPIDTAGLLAHLLPRYGQAGSPMMEAFQERVTALGASGRLFPPAEEVLGRAKEEAEMLLTKARDRAVEVTGDARARAEGLQRDVEERYRLAIGSLVQQREELERRVDDLRAFEREYRSRLLAYLEDQIRDLRAGMEDQP
jgi:transcriptional regulator with XRE-family HTH domain